MQGTARNPVLTSRRGGKPRMSKRIRDSARGQQCTVRLFPPCDDATVVAHHYHRRGFGKIGGKVSDLFTVHCCARCHAYAHEHPREPLVTERMLAGLIETQERLLEAGLVETK